MAKERAGSACKLDTMMFTDIVSIPKHLVLSLHCVRPLLGGRAPADGRDGYSCASCNLKKPAQAQ